jgi:hypothetical protein
MLRDGSIRDRSGDFREQAAAAADFVMRRSSHSRACCATTTPPGWPDETVYVVAGIFVARVCVALNSR